MPQSLPQRNGSCCRGCCWCCCWYCCCLQIACCDVDTAAAAPSRLACATASAAAAAAARLACATASAAAAAARLACATASAAAAAVGPATPAVAAVPAAPVAAEVLHSACCWTQLQTPERLTPVTPKHLPPFPPPPLPQVPFPFRLPVATPFPPPLSPLPPGCLAILGHQYFHEKQQHRSIPCLLQRGVELYQHRRSLAAPQSSYPQWLLLSGLGLWLYPCVSMAASSTISTGPGAVRTLSCRPFFGRLKASPVP